ncbi:hypothetical protein ACFL2U_01365 [Patescibacteria group bacterium]
MKISYSNILAQAWQITKKNRILWIFGIFASFISLEAVYEVIISQFNQLKNLDQFHLKLLKLYETQTDFFDLHIYFWSLFSKDYLAYLFVVLLIIIFFLLIWLVFTSQIFIIKTARRLYLKKKMATNDDLGDSFTHFWPVLGINILGKLIIYAGFIALSLPLLYALLTKDQAAIFSTNLFFFAAFTIFAVIISFIVAYATNFIVLKNLHIFEAFKQAWRLFSRNISISLELAFILFFLKILSIILILCLFALFFIPAMALFMLSISASSIMGLVASLTLIILAFTAISIMVNSLFTTFYLSCWTITFIKLTEETLFSKVIHFLKTIPEGIKYDKLGIDKNDVKVKVKKLAKQTEKQAKVVNRILDEQYAILAPKAKTQGKLLLKKLREQYIKLEPKIKKEIKKEVAKLKTKKVVKKKAVPKKKTVKIKPARKKTTAKRTPAKKAVKKTTRKPKKATPKTKTKPKTKK